MNLEQKLVEMRKAVPTLKKEKHSAEVKYKYARLDDALELLTPVMNALGVNTRVINEFDSSVEPFEWKVKNDYIKLMWVYRGYIEVEWVNADEPTDRFTKRLFACGWNDDPSKCKGAAHTYALKYDTFEMFSIPMDVDPDAHDYSQKYKPNVYVTDDALASTEYVSKEEATELVTICMNKWGKDGAGQVFKDVTGLSRSSLVKKTDFETVKAALEDK